MSDAEWKVLEAGSLLAQFESFGLIWLNDDLSVEDTFGPLVNFVTVGKPLTESLLPFIGLEADIRALRNDTRRVLELPAVAVMAMSEHKRRLNFTIFWNAGRDCAMALAYKSAAQTELEVELSRQIRARLMAEAEVAATAKALERANADLESFAAIVSHDLKAPLRHMRHMTEQAFDKAALDQTPVMRDLLRAIEQQSQRMSDMLTALFDYSSLGRKYEALEVIDTNALIHDIRASLPQSGHDIVIGGTWPEITTLRAPLDLVIRNLLCNAIQHHDRSSGTVTVSCTENQRALEIRVSDDGPGIDPQHHDAIFLPFRTIAQPADGCSTGMGLAAVKKTVETAGGSVEVLSAPAKQRGTTFLLQWPKIIRS
ncbi:MAG: HAMP domain-containing histidine kinase [Hyphomicrobium sp.]|nr:HAMP domain-containing histidine kinase [Hyphomicrobium sp.]